MSRSIHMTIHEMVKWLGKDMFRETVHRLRGDKS
jgi:hypothetical protein